MCLLHLWSSAYFSCTDIATHLLRERGKERGKGGKERETLPQSATESVNVCVSLTTGSGLVV